MAAEAKLSELSDKDRRELDSWLNEFSQDWHKGLFLAHSNRIRRLPEGSALGLAGLTGLIEMDMPRQWREGRQVRLETYLQAFPELGGPAEVSPDLIFAEYLVVQEFAGSGDLEEYLQRFPNQAS